MFGKFTRAMARHDLAHDFLLHETPRLIARRAFIVRKEFFDGVVIQRGHTVPKFFNSVYPFKVLIRKQL